MADDILKAIWRLFRYIIRMICDGEVDGVECFFILVFILVFIIGIIIAFVKWLNNKKSIKK